MKPILFAIAFAFVNSAQAKTNYLTLETSAGAVHDTLACPEDLVALLSSSNGAPLKILTLDINSGGLITITLDGSGPLRMTEVSIPAGSGCVLFQHR